MEASNETYRIGIDCGSTTVKVAVVNSADELVYKSYLRHGTNINSSVKRTFDEMASKLGNISASVAFTGSAGMQIASERGLSFVQEVVAAKAAVLKEHPDTDVVIELGGEDSKIIFLTGGEELRMNSTCAGGTGGFIDTIAGMLGTNAHGLARAAANSTGAPPIASRCAVFAQNDVRSLMNEGLSKEDIAASTFSAVVNQCVSGLACGRKIVGKVVFLGGPLNFLPPLASKFRQELGLDENTGVVPKDAHVYVALGCALSADGPSASLNEIRRKIGKLTLSEDTLLDYMEPLFESREQYSQFLKDHESFQIKWRNMRGASGPLFLGVDSGSTTIKGMLVDAQGQALWSYYHRNEGDVISGMRLLLRDLYQSMYGGNEAVSEGAYIEKAAITGYGESFLKQSFKLDLGVVETIAHLKAAQKIMADVDCVLDIGGQDIKCMRIRDGRIDDISLNEACSSGCGSLLSGFAHNMHMTDYHFVEAGIESKHPIDLGTRCTVFMTSRVRHAQKAGAEAGDICAGLAYSVVRNALYRVMNVKDVRELGENIVVQGGTFKNDTVLRAFEKLLGRRVARSDAPELMGAYGAALYALEHADGNPSAMLDAYQSSTIKVEKAERRCDLCQNGCRLQESCVTYLVDETGRFNPNIFAQSGLHNMGTDESGQRRVRSARFIMGNRCSKPETDEVPQSRGLDMVTAQYARLFRIDRAPSKPRARVGIPRALAMYEQFPFWQAFFTELGFEVVLSDESSPELYRAGMGNVTSESSCYPAKLAHGHIADLLGKCVEFIFYPKAESDPQSKDCPVISDYANILKLGMDSSESKPKFLSPRLPYSALGRWSQDDVWGFIQEMAQDVTSSQIAAACSSGKAAYRHYVEDIANLAGRASQYVANTQGKGVVLSCHPYHLDAQVNHSIPAMLTTYGLTVVTSDAVAALASREGELPLGCTGWRVPDRQLQAGLWCASRKAFELVSIYSFGCGIDALVLDELRGVCSAANKTFTPLKIDDMTDLASTRIRIRSLLAVLKQQEKATDDIPDDGDTPHTLPISKHKPALHHDIQGLTERQILIPEWMMPHMNLARRFLAEHGFNVMQPQRDSSVGTGLSTTNNDLCQTILSVASQIEDALARGSAPDVAVLIPFACANCCASNITGVCKNIVGTDGYTITHFEELIASNPDDTIQTELVQVLVAGDVIAQACAAALPAHPQMQFQDLCTQTIERVFKDWNACPSCLIESSLGVASELLADITFASTSIAVVGTASLSLTPSINNNVIDRVTEEGCQAIPASLTTQVMHNVSVLARTATGEAALACEIFMKRCRRIQQMASMRMEKLGIGYARALTYGELERVAEKHDLDSEVDSGMGWCAEASILSLLERDYLNALYVQTFSCLSSHVGGSGVFKEIREIDPRANLSSIEYDTGISQVNQINRIKLLAALAKG